MKILHISDWHSRNSETKANLEELKADILIDSGDICPHFDQNWKFGKNKRSVNKAKEAKAQREWFEKIKVPFYKSLGIKNIIVIQGNHDFTDFCGIEGITSLSKSGTIEVAGKKMGILLGANPTGENLWNDEIDEYEFKQRILSISPDIDILISHQPPSQVLDMAYSGERLGSVEIYKAIFGVIGEKEYFTHLKLHAYGHIHESANTKEIEVDDRKIIFSNASGWYNVIDI